MEEKVHESFPLEPFIHQVSGRSSMLSLDESTLCKTLIPRELAFYESLPDELKPLVPEFRGMIEVEFSETCDGYVALTARPPLNSSFTSNSLSSKRQAKHRIRRQESGCIEIESAENSPQQSTQSNQSMQSFIFENGFYYEKDGSNSNINCAKNNNKHNPWVLRCQQQHLDRLEFDKSSQDNTISNKVTKSFILLENLTAKFSYPCVLDIKLGLRFYDDDASENKRMNHDIKVRQTTSGSMGLRICGIQVYNKKLDRFICHNKYYGRSLDTNGFTSALKLFLHNGNELRYQLIPNLIQRLESLLSVMVKLDAFRFYTTSLLLLYEGKCDDNSDKSTSDSSNLIDIRMIDFAHSSKLPTSSNDPNQTQGPDTGLIFGIQNLIKQLDAIYQQVVQ